MRRPLHRVFVVACLVMLGCESNETDSGELPPVDVVLDSGEADGLGGDVGIADASSDIGLPDVADVRDTENPDSGADVYDVAGDVAEPLVVTLSVAPEAPTTLDDLVADITIESAGSSAPELTYRWWRGETSIAEPFDPPNRVPASATAAGETWTVRVFGPGSSDALASASVSVVNSAPTCAAAVATPEMPSASTDIVCTCTDRSDVDGDSALDRCDMIVSGQPVDAPNCVLPAGSAAKGDSVVCRLYPSDGMDEGPPVDALPLTVVNTPPPAPVLGVNPVDPTAVSTLTCTVLPGPADMDGDPVTTETVWQVNGEDSAVIGPSVTVGALGAKKGDLIRCAGTASDGEATSGVAVSAAVEVLNTAPSAGTVAISPSEPSQSDALTCTPTGFVDPDVSDTLTYTVEWVVAGKVVSGQTALELPAGVAGKGDAVRCRLVASDGASSTDQVSSPVVFVQNALPTLVSAVVSPSQPTRLSNLECTPVGLTDADDPNPTVTATWTVNGGAAPSPLDASGLSPGDVLTCTLLPSDGTDVGASVTSAPVTVVNLPPTVNAAVVLPTSPATTTELTCVASGAFDPEGDPLDLAITWLKFGEPIGGQTAATLAPEWTASGDVIRCRIAPSDSFSDGLPVTSGAVPVGNSAPTGTLVLTPSEGHRFTNFECQLSEVADADGDPVDELVSLTVNGVPVETLPSLSGGDWVGCVATLSDGVVETPLTTLPVEVQNTAPSIGSVTVSPDSPVFGSTLACVTSEVVDPEGDPVSVEVQWFSAGSVLEGETATTLAGPPVVEGAEISCSVVPSDGELAGATLNSAPVTVQNTPPTVSGVTVLPASPLVGAVFECVFEVDDVDEADAPLLESQITWWVDDAEVPSPNATKGQAVRCEVTVSDGQSSAGPESSASVVVGNSLPAVASALITPSSPLSTDALTCVPGDFTDADGDPPGFTYRWWQGDSLVAGQTGAELPPGVIQKGQAVRCEVTPTDGQGEGAPVLSPAVTVGNAPPIVGSAVMSPGVGGLTTEFTCTAGDVSDPDGDSVTPSYGWLIDGEAIPGAFQSTYTPSGALPGAVLSCRARASDGATFGAFVVSETVVLDNAPPTVAAVTIVPGEPTSVDELTCMAIDPDDLEGQTVTLDYAWRVGGALVAGATGTTLSASQFAKGQAVVCEVTPSDPFSTGETVSQSVVIGNSAPAAESVTMTPESPTTDTPLDCVAVGVTDPDADPVVLSWRWEVAGLTVPNQVDSTLPAGVVQKDESVQCFVVPADADDAGAEVAGPLRTLGNSAPTVGAVTLLPEVPTVGSEFECTAEQVSDPDGDTVTLSYAWFVADSLVPDAESSTLASGVAVEGQSVRCRVTPTDSASDGAPVESVTRTVENSPPVVVSVELAPATGGVTTVYTCTVVADDPDAADSPVVAIAWRLAGELVDGATDSTFVPSVGQRDQELTCEATASDEAETSSPLVSEVVVLQNTPPSTGTPTVSPQSPAVTDALTCTPSGWSDADGDTPGYLYQWHIEGTISPDHTEATLPAGAATRGQEVTCRVTPNDGIDPGSPAESEVVVVQNTLPTLASAAVTPSEPTSSDELTCVPAVAFDADGDVVVLRYAWWVEDALADGETGSTLSPTAFERGQSVRCTVTPADDVGDGVTVESAVVDIGNSPPTATGAVVSPASPKTDDPLTCVMTGFADVDGDAEGATYRWWVDDQLLINQPGATLPAVLIQKGQSIRCGATPFDGVASGVEQLAPAVQVGNSAPVVESVTITPELPDTTDILDCVFSVTDADESDSPNAAVTWLVAGATVGTGPTLPAGTAQRGDSVVCQVVPSDEDGDGLTASSAEIVIQDAPPTLGAPVISPAEPVYCDTLSCFAAGDDPDGDSVTVTYSWTVDGQPAGDGAMLSLVDASPGEMVVCTATVGALETTATRMLGNSAPVVSDASVSPASPVVGQVLTCMVGEVTDTECDPEITTDVVWLVGGVASGTGTTLSTEGMAPDTAISCRVTANDGFTDSAPVTAPTVNLASADCDPPCDDGAACTTDSCVLGQCETTPVEGCEPCTVDAECATANLCEVGTCVLANGETSGQCETSARVCYDGLSCTQDVCEPDAGCQFRAASCETGCVEDADCDDGNLCTDDLCDQNGECGNPVRVCDDGDPCTFDVCTPDNGECIAAPHPSCDDTGGICETAEDCPDAGACLYAGCVGAEVKRCLYEVRRCNDYDSCTQDSCDPESGCVFADTGECAPGQCGTAAQCNDDNACTVDACVDNVCATSCTSNDDCDDDDPETADICDLAGRCVHEITGTCGNPGDCDDDNACTIDRCIEGTCEYTTVLCEDELACTRDRTPCGVTVDSLSLFGAGCDVQPSIPACDPSVGCLHLPELGCGGDALPAGQNGFMVECTGPQDCETGQPCVPGACVDGVCEVAPVLCPPPGPGSVAYCDPQSGGCVAIPTDGEGSCGSDTDCRLAAGLTGLDRCSVGFCDVPSGQCVYAALECDDSNPCTVDSCDPNSGCQFDPLPGCFGCTGDDQCDDGDPCTEDACFEGACEHEGLPNCVSCVEQTCVVGGTGLECECVVPTLPVCPFVPCQTDLECADESTCTIDTCLPNGQCENTPVRCRFNQPCVATDGVCVEDVGCVPTPSGCDQACTAPEDCDSPFPCIEASCVDGQCDLEPVVCDDGDPCTDDICHPVTETCTSVPNPTCEPSPCADASDCPTLTDGACAASVCIDGFCLFSPVVCDDFTPCTADSCSPSGACVFEPIAGCTECVGDGDCSDGDECTLDTCANGDCLFEPNDGCIACDTSADCPLSNQACRFPSCNAGACVYDDLEGCIVCDPNDPEETIAIECGDGLFCTQDVCDPVLQICTNELDPSLPGCKPTLCDSQNDCPQPSNCDYWTCDHSQEPAQCVQFVLPGCPLGCSVDLDCADGNACTIDRCSDVGECIYTAKQCVDDLPCSTVHECEPATGCIFVPDTACEEGFCQSPEHCDTGDACLSGQCTPQGCVVEPMDCDDDDPCTLNWCEAGGCQSAPAPGCDAGPCAADSDCAETWVMGTGAPSSACVVPVCEAGECAIYARDCDDSTPCTADSCDPATGCVFAPIAGCTLGCEQNEQCDDDDADTEDTCVSGACLNVYKPECAGDYECFDSNACTVDRCTDGVCTYTSVLCFDDKPCTKDLAPCGGALSDIATEPFYDSCDEGEGQLPACHPDVGCFHLPVLNCGSAIVDGGVVAEVECEFDSDCDTGHLCRPGTCVDGNCFVDGVDCPDPGPDMQAYCDWQTGECVTRPFPGWTHCTAHEDCRYLSEFAGDLELQDEEGVRDGYDRCAIGFCNLGADTPAEMQCMFFEKPCNDMNPCTVDSCDLETGCVYTPIPGCQGCTTHVDCDDFDPCSTDSCLPDGNCQHDVAPGCAKCTLLNTDRCFDGDPCTKDTCDVEANELPNEAGECTYVPFEPSEKPECFAGCGSDQDCADGDPCTVDRCEMGLCVNAPPDCLDGRVCTLDLGCSPEAPGCAHEPLMCTGEPCTEPSDCETGDLCFTATCVDGACESSFPICDDGDPTTIDYCDPATGACASIPAGKPSCDSDGDCDDGSACTTDFCQPELGICIYNLISCSDFDPCTADVCDPAAGCQFADIPDCTGCVEDIDCDDGSACTQDVCGGFGEAPGQCISLPLSDLGQPEPPGCSPPPPMNP